MATHIDPEAQEQARLEALAFEMHMRPEDYAAYERDMAEMGKERDGGAYVNPFGKVTYGGAPHPGEPGSF